MCRESLAYHLQTFRFYHDHVKKDSNAIISVLKRQRNKQDDLNVSAFYRVLSHSAHRSGLVMLLHSAERFNCDQEIILLQDLRSFQPIIKI